MPTFSGSVVSTNDYGSVNEVRAFTRHLLDGQSTFNSTTRPTLTDVTRFLTRASGMMNTALAMNGFTIPVSQADAKAAIDDWVTQRATEYVELTQRGVGYSDAEGSRTSSFRNLSNGAQKFVKDNALGLKRLGATVSQKTSQGLQFTGLDAPLYREDPDDSTLAQPAFSRGLFNVPGTGGVTTPEDVEDED